MSGAADRYPGIVPDSLAQTLVEVHGEPGRVWIQDLPRQVAHLSERWELELGEPFENLSYNLVIRARRRGRQVVLKLGVPPAEFECEAAALRAFAGEGAAVLFDVEPGATLLEQVLPGRMLAEAGEEEAVRVAGALMTRLWRPAPSRGPFPDLAKWTAGMERVPEGVIAPETLDRALELREELLDSSPGDVLLHGDLHHFNILSAEREPYLAIDPKGVVGEPAFETVAFLVNPEPKSVSTLDRRVRILCEVTGLDRRRVIRWSVVFGVLSACWTFEDHGGIGTGALDFGEKMATLL